MNLDEETFLTAYLDDELDPELRLGVDSALLSSPALVEDLRDLTAVRDLVAGLGRPAPAVDISVAVLSMIRRRSDAGPFSRVIGLAARRTGRPAWSLWSRPPLPWSRVPRSAFMARLPTLHEMSPSGALSMLQFRCRPSRSHRPIPRTAGPRPRRRTPPTWIA